MLTTGAESIHTGPKRYYQRHRAAKNAPADECQQGIYFNPSK